MHARHARVVTELDCNPVLAGVGNPNAVAARPPARRAVAVECEMAAERLREAEAKAAAAEARATAAEARVAQLNTLSPSEEGYRLCLVCHERPRERAPPCGHCCVCSDCANHTAVKFSCPVCREPFPAGEWRPVFL